MLRCALNQPIQRVPLLDLKPLVRHGTRSPSAAAVAEFLANRVGMDPGPFVAHPEEARTGGELAQVETGYLVAPVVRFRASELNLTVVLEAPD